MDNKWVLGATMVLLAQAIGCDGGKKAEAMAGSASPAASAAATAATAAPSVAAAAAPAAAEELIPNTPELKRDAEYYYKEAHKKPKAAVGMPGVRVPGGCTSEKAMSGTKVGCYGMKQELMLYLQNELLVKDGWTIDKKSRGVAGEVLIEASKGDKKIGVAVSTLDSTMNTCWMTILPR